MVLQLSFVDILLASGFYVLGPVVARERLGGAVGWGVVLTGQALGIDVYEVLFDTALQKNVAPEALSRVMSYQKVGAFAVGPVVLLLPSVRSAAPEPQVQAATADAKSGA